MQEMIYNVNNYPYQEIGERLRGMVVNKMQGSRRKGKKKITARYYNVPAAFDIETTSLHNGDTHTGFMYHWQFDIMAGKHFVIFGRTWQEFIEFTNNIQETLNLGGKNRLVVFVHNLAYEYEFTRNFLETERLFATDKRKPLTWLTTKGLEFRCSYRLSNMSLAKFCENSRGVTHFKKGGDLDYRVIRTPKTELTQEEKEYCYNDVAGLCECIADKLTEDTLATMPLTSTGYVRRTYQKEVAKNPRYFEWFQSTAIDAKTYEMARLAFRGGDTCANPIYTGKTLENVISYDIQSSYPAVMAYENRFPMGKWKEVEFSPEYLNTHACLFKVCFEDIFLKPKYTCPYIDIAHLHNAKKPVNVNGRMLRAEYCEIYVTEIDFKIIMQEYQIDGDIYIEDFMICERGYLPREIRNVLIDLYTMKTQLKDVSGKEYEYGKSKNMVNASYGMAVSSIIHPEILDEVEGRGWYEEENTDVEGTLEKYYKNANHFLHYTWGVYVTAMARERLRDMIHYLSTSGKAGKGKFVYADTDSVKFLTYDRIKDEKYIAKLNRAIIRKGKRVTPKATAQNKDGKEFPLGIWDFDNDTKDGYRYFKTYGAKKYAYECFDKKGNYGLHITIAGCSKGASRILEEKARRNGTRPIDEFKTGAVIDEMILTKDDGTTERVTSGRTTSWFNDVTQAYTIKVGYESILTGSNIAIEETSYTLGVTDEYRTILHQFGNNLENVEINIDN